MAVLKKVLQYSCAIVFGLVLGIAVRLWFPLSEAVWLGGLPAVGATGGGQVVSSGPGTGPAAVQAAERKAEDRFWQDLAAATSQTIPGLLDGAWRDMWQKTQAARVLVNRDRVQALWRRCLELAPAEALSWFRSLSATEQTCCQDLFFKDWIALDPKAGGAALQEFEDGLVSISQPEAITGLLESDPAAALTLALDLPVGPLRARTVERALLALMQRDPAAAFGQLRQLDDRQNTTALAKAMIQSLAKSDLNAAKESIASFPAGPLRSVVLRHLAEAAMEQGAVQETLSWLRQLPSPQDQTAALSGMNGERWDRKIDRFFEEAVRADLPSALSLFDQLKTNPAGLDGAARLANAAQGLYQEWRKSDPSAALQWVMDQPAGVFSSFADKMRGIIRERGTGVLTELGLAADSPAWMNKEEFYGQVDLKSMEAARVLGDEGGLIYADELVTDPKGMSPAAMKALLAGLPQDAFRSGMAARFAGAIAGKDAQAAVEMMAIASVDLPLEELRRFTGDLASNAPQATSQWLQGMVPGEFRDVVIGQLIPVILADGDPAAAFQWAASLTDETQQLQWMTPALSAWQLADPVAAAAALETSNLNGAARSSLQQLLTPP